MDRKLFWGVLFLVALSVSLAPAAERLDFWGEAPRLFGAVKAGGDITADRSLRAERNYTAKGFSLDHVDKRCGDFSVLFSAQQLPGAQLVGFTPGPYQETFPIAKQWSLHLWLKAQARNAPGHWPLVLIDDQGRRAQAVLKDFAANGQWCEFNLPLANFDAEQGFDYQCIRAGQLEFSKSDPQSRIWFDGIYFVNPDNSAEVGVTDKSVEQRMAEAAASRALRVEQAFQAGARASHKPGLKKRLDRLYRSALNEHFAKLWLGQDIEAVNQELLHLFTTDDKETRAYYGIEYPWHLAMTPFPHRLYYTFSHNSKIKPGRLTPETEKALLELLWVRTATKNDIQLARQSTWWMTGSENHDLNAKASVLLASQIFMHEPQFAQRALPNLGAGGGSGYWFHIVPGEGRFHGPEGRGQFKDGKQYIPRDHYRAWVDYLMEYFTERAKKGFFLEVASDGYMRHTVSFISDIYSFCEDEALRERARKFLDLLWAEWAQDEISGARGGAKTRCKRGAVGRDAMYHMASFYLGGPGDAKANFHQLWNDYSFPKIVWQMALDRQGMGSFAYRSRKPGEEPPRMPRPLGTERTLLCDTESRLLRYSWVTPDYILGTQMDHPLAVHSHLSIQSRWQGISFSTSPDARVFPCGLDVTEPEKWKVIQDSVYRSVQHENVLITQLCRNWTEINPDWFPGKDRSVAAFGVYLGDEPDRIDEKDGWIFLAEGNAYLAIRIILTKYTPNSGVVWLEYKATEKLQAITLEDSYRYNADRTMIQAKEKYCPIIFEAAPRNRYDCFEDFQRDILDNQLEVTKTTVPGWHVLTYQGCGSDAPEIYFNAANNEIPMINGQRINYAPDMVFDSPYMKSKYNSGVVILRKGPQTLALDFNSK